MLKTAPAGTITTPTSPSRPSSRAGITICTPTPPPMPTSTSVTAPFMNCSSGRFRRTSALRRRIPSPLCWKRKRPSSAASPSFRTGFTTVSSSVSRAEASARSVCWRKPSRTTSPWRRSGARTGAASASPLSASACSGTGIFTPKCTRTSRQRLKSSTPAASAFSATSTPIWSGTASCFRRV